MSPMYIKKISISCKLEIASKELFILSLFCEFRFKGLVETQCLRVNSNYWFCSLFIGEWWVTFFFLHPYQIINCNSSSQSYAKEHNDAKLMVKIMQILQRNSLPLQPGTADIVFRYLKSIDFGFIMFFYVSVYQYVINNITI